MEVLEDHRSTRSHHRNPNGVLPLSNFLGSFGMSAREAHSYPVVAREEMRAEFDLAEARVILPHVSHQTSSHWEDTINALGSRASAKEASGPLWQPRAPQKSSAVESALPEQEEHGSFESHYKIRIHLLSRHMIELGLPLFEISCIEGMSLHRVGVEALRSTPAWIAPHGCASVAAEEGQLRSPPSP